jgi:hypothetical protein
MEPDLALRLFIDPTLAWLDSMGVRSTDQARAMLVGIALQESKLLHRCQVVNGGGRGPARGFWQFERGGGVAGVLKHASTERPAGIICDALCVQATPQAVWEALEQNDILACAFARLLLWTDPRPLPQLRQIDEAWAFYLRNWRPGKPHPDAWAANWQEAVATVNRG